jgi:hypothetical protein
VTNAALSLRFTVIELLAIICSPLGYG